MISADLKRNLDSDCFASVVNLVQCTEVDRSDPTLVDEWWCEMMGDLIVYLIVSVAAAATMTLFPVV